MVDHETSLSTCRGEGGLELFVAFGDIVDPASIVWSCGSVRLPADISRRFEGK